jgi:uncharacterized Tic20 family protein
LGDCYFVLELLKSAALTVKISIFDHVTRSENQIKMNDSTKQKLLRSICHASALASPTMVVLGVPIAALFVSDDPLVKDSAKEALNFTMSMYLWAALFGALMFTLVGIPAAVLGFFGLWAASMIFPIVAIASVCADPDKQYRYPLTIHFLGGDKPRLRAEI